MKLKKSWRKALSLTLCGVVLAASVVVGPLTTPAQAVSQWEIDAL